MLRSNTSKAHAYFNEAMSLSRDNGFIHREGLIDEIEWLFFLQLNSLDPTQQLHPDTFN